jgi:hypothetical protein
MFKNNPLKKGRTPKEGVAQYYSVACACFAGGSFASCGRDPSPRNNFVARGRNPA